MYIPDSIWTKYKDIINNAHDDFNKDIISLFTTKKSLDRFSEGKLGYDSIDLECLVQYNVFRTWPMTKGTTSGDLDEESITVYLNNKYLSTIGLISTSGNFKFNPGSDYFIFKGQRYRSSGETPVSQAKDEPLFTLLILKRTPTRTSEEKY
jgi:hypothetical protein